ncbi:hypothetical protein APHAL10511_000195 [Amanita phalloides]|nr:hypothetical protein APHAL10511_000195 [Amanita phalloides]
MGSSASKPEPRQVACDEKRTPELPALPAAAVPASLDGSISSAAIVAWETAVVANPKLRLARAILSHTDIRIALASRTAHIADPHIFNVPIDFNTGPVTNQKNSGRCWLFATTNVIRYAFMKRLSLKDFQLSQSYLFFWDKLNKSNYFLELVIHNSDLPLDSRLMHHLSQDPIGDGGQWDMVVNLMETYGLVPQALYPESTHSSLSGPLNTMLTTKLREHGLILRRLASSLRSASVTETQILIVLRSRKEELMNEVYNILTATLGRPPSADEKFVWEYVDNNNKVGRWEGTPIDFYKTFASKPYSPADSFSLINDPRNEYSKLYTVDKLGNVWGGRPILYVNTEIERMKDAVVKLIKLGHPVFFGCDVGKFSESASGIMDTALFEYENAFDIKFGLTKAERLQTYESSMTHAMVISGVHLDQSGKPVRYKVENSWGETSGNKGYFVMTDAWFEQFVYQVVIPKALAPKDLVQIYESGEMIVLPAWDPMGSLA